MFTVHGHDIRPLEVIASSVVDSVRMSRRCAVAAAWFLKDYVSSVLRFSPIMGFENSLVGVLASHSAGANPG